SPMVAVSLVNTSTLLGGLVAILTLTEEEDGVPVTTHTPEGTFELELTSESSWLLLSTPLTYRRSTFALKGLDEIPAGRSKPSCTVACDPVGAWVTETLLMLAT